MLPLHVGGDLDPRHAPDVDSHLSGCLPCFREFRELGAMRQRLILAAEEPLPTGILHGFAEEVMARVAVREPGPVAQAPRPGPRLLLLPRMAAAAAVLLVAVAGWRVFSDGGMAPGMGSGRTAAGSLPATPVGTSLGTPGNLPIQPPSTQPAGEPGAPVLRFFAPPDAKAQPVYLESLPHGLPESGLPSEEELQLRARGAKGYLLMSGATHDGLQPDDQRQPRSRNP